MADEKPTLAVLGGTGALGSGLAARWVGARYPVLIGSRTSDKAEAAALALGRLASGPKPRGMTNLEAAQAATVVVLTVPYASAAALIDEVRDAVKGKLVIDTTVPLMPPRVARVQLPPEGSAAVAAQKRFGSEVRVVSAFHNVSAHKLQGEAAIANDVLVFGDRAEDRAIAVTLAQAAGMRGLHAGPLVNSVAAEALTSVLIGINRGYKVDGASIHIAAVPAGATYTPPAIKS